MVDPTYQIVEANGWWGPAPEVGKTAVAQRWASGMLYGLLTISAEPEQYHAFACIHPHSTKKRSRIAEMGEFPVSYCAGDSSESQRQLLAFVHSAGRARYSEGLFLLHAFTEGLRHVLLGEPVPVRDPARINDYGQEPPIVQTFVGPMEGFPPSPYRPFGDWGYVAPEHPFDFRVRATCTYPNLRPLSTSLEQAVLKAIDIHNIEKPGRTGLVTGTNIDLLQ